jgi:hypothetical protein
VQQPLQQLEKVPLQQQPQVVVQQPLQQLDQMIK